RGIWRRTDGDDSEAEAGAGRAGSRFSAAEHARHGRSALGVPRAQARPVGLPERDDLTILPPACVAVATRVSTVSKAGRRGGSGDGHAAGAKGEVSADLQVRTSVSV